jgi:undecaprenyl-diphosphatase
VEIWQAILLGIVEGITEFLPVSSTGHLTFVEGLMGMQVDDPAVTAYTAIIQIGAIAAALIYFRVDIIRFVKGFFRGIMGGTEGRQDPDWRMSLYVIVGSLPVAVVGLAARPLIEGPLRSVWVVANALILWCLVMVFAEYKATQKRGEGDLTFKDAIIIGGMQCFSLIPGVSRSGATISAGLLVGLDRVTSTRLSFFLGIPALTAAGVLEAVTWADEISATVGWVPTAVGAVVSFFVAYASIAWLLKFVANHSLVSFVWYRLAVGVALIALLATGVIAT